MRLQPIYDFHTDNPLTSLLAQYNAMWCPARNVSARGSYHGPNRIELWPWKMRILGVSQFKRHDQHGRANKYPQQKTPGQNDRGRQQTHRQDDRTRSMDDDQRRREDYSNSPGSSSRNRDADDQERRSAGRGGNTRPGNSDRRTSRPSSQRLPPGRGAQRYGGVADWEDGPHDWDDEEWRSDHRPAYDGSSRRPPNRGAQKTRAIYDDERDWDDSGNRNSRNSQNNWDNQAGRANDGRYGRAPSARRNDARRGGRVGWLEASRQWAAVQGQHLLGTGKRVAQGDTAPKSPERRRRIITIVVLAVILVCGLGSSLTSVVLYVQMNAMAHSGLQHVKNAEADLKKVQSNPFDATSIQAAHDEFAAAYGDFSGVNARLNLVGLASVAPVVGSKVSGAQKLVPIAAEATQAGMLACDAMSVLAASLKHPFGTTGGTLTRDQYAIIVDKWAQIRPLAHTIIEQLGQLTPSDLSLDPRLGPIVGQFVTKLPQITQLVDDFDGVVAALPQLMGIEKPSNYLMLILDSSELRPTGGFIGNFGALGVNKGQMDPGFHITDITLIDANVKFPYPQALYPQTIQIPDKYNWLKSVFDNPASASWSLRDSNLDPDYPTASKYAIDLYSQLQPGAQRNLSDQGSTLKLYDPKASGQFAGVITLSLGFFVQALKITKDIDVVLQTNHGTIHETVNSDNFVSKIHYYALSGTGGTGPDNQACGTTSCSKVFTSAVVKAFMDKIKANLSQYIGPLGKVFFESLRTKDIEIFVNDPKAEQALIDIGVGASVQAPKTGDSVFEVEANIGANKDNGFLQYKLSDQITIDQSGTATHKLVWQYIWPADPKTIAESFPAGGPGGNFNYHSHSRVFVPPTATYITQTGLQGAGQTPASAETFNRQVLFGEAFGYYGRTMTYSLAWKTPGVVTHDDAGYHYTLLFQRQAGIVWPQTLTINLPACAKVVGTPQTSGLTSLNAVTVKGTTVTVTGPLTLDEQFQINYTC